jgi:hypothetical protein
MTWALGIFAWKGEDCPFADRVPFFFFFFFKKEYVYLLGWNKGANVRYRLHLRCAIWLIRHERFGSHNTPHAFSTRSAVSIDGVSDIFGAFLGRAFSLVHTL